jgi:hypothetical protein
MSMKKTVEKVLWFAALGSALIGLAGFIELLHALAVGLILGAVGELIGE